MSSKSCNCSTLCSRREYNAVYSNSMLDMNKIRNEIEKQNRMQEILMNQRKAMDIAAQVRNCNLVARGVM